MIQVHRERREVTEWHSENLRAHLCVYLLSATWNVFRKHWIHEGHEET